MNQRALYEEAQALQLVLYLRSLLLYDPPMRLENEQYAERRDPHDVPLHAIDDQRA